MTRQQSLSLTCPGVFKHALAWVVSAFMVLAFFFGMIFFKHTVVEPEKELTVRKIDVVLPPPPPPPPSLRVEPSTQEHHSPSIDLIGTGEGPKLKFSAKPKLAFQGLERVKQPEFDISDIDFKKTLSIDIPTFEVEELDSVPRMVSYASVRFPRDVARRGIKRVATKVEIIIDLEGKVYIKKIIDPVYPEMVAVIRDWAAGVKFTVPTKHGKPVQAVYRYTIEFVNRV